MRLFALFFVLLSGTVAAQTQQVRIGLVKYGGGGDWYADPTALPNLIAFCNANLKTNIHPEPSTVEVGSTEIFIFRLFISPDMEILFCRRMKPSI